MTREEKAHSLGQMYFPDDQCIWARPNYEAKFVSDACMQMAGWERNRFMEKACLWLRETAHFYVSDFTGELDDNGLLEDFKKAMEE
jgi:hypothetical protein